MTGIRAASAALMALTLAGCAGGPSLLPNTPAARVADAAMPGRWILAAPNAPVCGLNFAGAPGKPDGTLAPEGGCPERFFTSRRWTLDQGTLTIKDDDDNTLATLSFTGGRFEGKSAAGTPLTLTR